MKTKARHHTRVKVVEWTWWLIDCRTGTEGRSIEYRGHRVGRTAPAAWSVSWTFALLAPESDLGTRTPFSQGRDKGRRFSFLASASSIVFPTGRVNSRHGLDIINAMNDYAMVNFISSYLYIRDQ